MTRTLLHGGTLIDGKTAPSEFSDVVSALHGDPLADVIVFADAPRIGHARLEGELVEVPA